MNSITYNSAYEIYSVETVHKNLLTRFLTWAKSEEKNRIAWMGISITTMSAVFFPITMSAILFNGAIFKLIIGSIFSLALVVIANLAALPTKYTIPAFIAGIIIDIVLILASFII
jgi:hypothetical protein